MEFIQAVETVTIGDTMVTNLRQHEPLEQSKDALNMVIAGIDNGVTNDLLTMDIRQALHQLGEITGEIIRQSSDRQPMIYWRMHRYLLQVLAPHLLTTCSPIRKSISELTFAGLKQ